MDWDWTKLLPGVPIPLLYARNLAQQVQIATSLNAFVKTGDPLHVWEIIDICTKSDPPIPFPKEILQYLKRTSSTILDMAENNPESAKSWILKALGFVPGKERNLSFVNYRRGRERAAVVDWIFQQVVSGKPWMDTLSAASEKFRFTENSIREWMPEFFPGKPADEDWGEYLPRFRPPDADFCRAVGPAPI